MKKIKKFFIFLCILILFFGISGCPDNNDQSSFSTTPKPATPLPDPEPIKPSPVPEPTTLILLGSGLVGLAAFGRKKIKK